MNNTYTVPEMAKLKGVTRQRVYAWIKQKHFPHTWEKIHGRIVITVKS